MKNIWLLTEERPKRKVVKEILEKFFFDFNYKFKIDNLKIIPILFNNKFSFTYEVVGLKSPKVKRIFIKSTSGSSSFVDFLLFYQDKEPRYDSIPLYAIEETKTDDLESRNTGVYQRCSKFVFIDFYYPQVKKIMLYNLQIQQKDSPTDTYIFGTRMLLTLGVEIMGKNLDPKIFKSFKNIDGLINLKNKMAKPYYGIPVKLKKQNNKIYMSAKLEKEGRLTHDPNIGMTTIIAACLRKLNWRGDVIIKEHNLPNQKSVGKKNKFILIANKINIKLSNFKIPRANIPDNYWKYEYDQEKIATIFIHLLSEEYTNGMVIYENHGGCERGYFIVNNDKKKYLAIPKYSDREKYKKGNKNYIIYIPDIVIYDKKRNIIVNIEGKTYRNKDKGIKELKNYVFFENKYIKKYYPNASIQRTVVLNGGSKKSIRLKKIGFLLNSSGELIISQHTPEIIQEAVKNLFSSQ